MKADETPSDFFPADIIRVTLNPDWGVSIEFSPALLSLFILLVLGFWFLRSSKKRFDIVQLDIPLGGFGKVTLQPNYTDIQIAHKIWTELVTRKAAIKIDPENDVISEVYDSWYALFQRVRQLISEIPADLIRKNESTKILVGIATQSLNKGLRPHLTRWHARFRNWSNHQEDRLQNMSPQEVQREFPEYEELMDDLMRVNDELIKYADELKKVALG